MVIGLVIGTQEIILIVLAIALLFGAARIPQFMRGLGQGIKEFKGAVKDSGADTPPASASDPSPDSPAANTANGD